MFADLLPVAPAVVCTASSDAIVGPAAVYDVSYFSVMPVGVLKKTPAWLLPPTCSANTAITSAFAAVVVIDVVVATVPRPLLPADASIGLVVSTPL
jgi:hypothetical protein